MATIGDDPNGRKRILFVATDGSRKTVRMGKATIKQATEFKLHVEHLVSAAALGRLPDKKTAEWLADLSDDLYSRLVAVGLAKERQSAGAVALGPFIDSYIADRTDAKSRTLINLKSARKDLGAFFGDAKLLVEITPADAAEFWRYLLRAPTAGGRGLNTNTARRVCGRAKQFFAVAIDKGIVASNPFRKLKTRVQSNHDRKAFIDRTDFAKVLNACPSTEWKLVFALCRYGGLRCPSEVLALKWQHINFEAGTMLVPSPKTEQHEGGSQRLVPLFAELKPLLLQAFTEAAEGAQYVIGRSRDAGVNLRTQAQRIIERAGVTPWPKLFVNLRASRATELAGEYPGHVCAKWLGHTEAIADEFYRQVRDEDFQKAIGEGGTGAAQNPAQYPSKSVSNDLEAVGAGAQKSPDLPGNSAAYNSLPHNGIPPRGVEPRSSG